MSMPTPRGPLGGEPTPGGRDPLTGYIAEALRRLEDSVTRGFDVVNMQLSKLPDQYVARRDFDRYRDEMNADWQQAVQKRDVEVKRLCDEHDTDITAVRREVAENEARRVARGRYVLTTLIALAAVLLALAALVLSRR